MPLNRAFVGRSYRAGGTFEVSREHIRRFAQAIGDANPAYLDRSAATDLGHPDVVAPPTFLTTVGLSLPDANGPLSDPDLGIDLGLVVHGEQRYVHHRPVRPGDELTATTTITDIRDAGANELLSMTTEIRTTAGELVATSYNTIVSRGTAATASGEAS
ncbi:MAG: MaoC family dehydratase N-terminal domain-containing protein [Frankiales bacterium]|nr:MaoC family dehydratase N-terminal domain-containing protein [Frankiales bacterium]